MAFAVDTQALSAYATAAAVVVALGGPVWTDWYRRKRHSPKLELTVAESTATLSHRTEPAEGITLQLRNDEKRNKAEDVEIFLSGSGTHAGDDYSWHLAAITPITVGDSYTTTVPPNFSRLFAIGWLRYGLSQEALADRCEIGWVATADHPQLKVFKIGFEYQMHIAVTGSNFDARFWQGTLAIRSKRVDDDELSYESVWTRELKPSRHREFVHSRLADGPAAGETAP